MAAMMHPATRDAPRAALSTALHALQLHLRLRRAHVPLLPEPRAWPGCHHVWPHAASPRCAPAWQPAQMRAAESVALGNQMERPLVWAWVQGRMVNAGHPTHTALFALPRGARRG
eukprot:365403-Chlamydomonas_euryale.AAC.11